MLIALGVLAIVGGAAVVAARLLANRPRPEGIVGTVVDQWNRPVAGARASISFSDHYADTSATGAFALTYDPRPLVVQVRGDDILPSARAVHPAPHARVALGVWRVTRVPTDGALHVGTARGDVAVAPVALQVRARAAGAATCHDWVLAGPAPAVTADRLLAIVRRPARPNVDLWVARDGVLATVPERDHPCPADQARYAEPAVPGPAEQAGFLLYRGLAAGPTYCLVTYDADSHLDPSASCFRVE